MNIKEFGPSAEGGGCESHPWHPLGSDTGNNEFIYFDYSSNQWGVPSPPPLVLLQSPCRSSQREGGMAVVGGEGFNEFLHRETLRCFPIIPHNPRYTNSQSCYHSPSLHHRLKDHQGNGWKF